MFFIAVLALLFIVVFLIFVGRQSASVQRTKKSQRGIWQNTESDLSILSVAPLQDIPHSNATDEVSYHHASVSNYATDNVVDSGVVVSSIDSATNYDSGGGDLGSALAGAIDSGSSFSGFDSSSAVGGGGDFSGGCDFGGGSTTDGSTS
jgi:hypothetical protein